MSPFVVLVAAAVALAVSILVGSQTSNKKLEAAMQGVSVAAVLVILGCVAVGLWQAWSPWEIVRKTD